MSEMWSSWAMWEWTQLWKQESFAQAAEGGTMQTSLEIRSKTEKWDESPMGISTSTHSLHPLCLICLKGTCSRKVNLTTSMGIVVDGSLRVSSLCSAVVKDKCTRARNTHDIQAYSTEGRWFFFVVVLDCFLVLSSPPIRHA